MTPATQPFVEEVEIQGHIIDSLLLPKVLDEILTQGGSYVIKDIRVGQKQTDASYARIEVRAESAKVLQQMLDSIHDHGAVPTTTDNCHTIAADMDGAYPEEFYSTTNYRTQVRLGGEWIDVEDQEMDCGILVDADGSSARCIAMTDVHTGDLIVVGRQGLRVFPAETQARQNLFEFMASPVSSEKPKGVTVREIANAMKRTREAGEKILAVLGPAVVHTGSAEHIVQLIRTGYLDILFAGNAAGHARHRTEPVRHQSGHLRRPRLAHGRRPRTPPPRHQHHPPAGQHPLRRRARRVEERHHVRVHQAPDSVCPRRQHPR